MSGQMYFGTVEVGQWIPCPRVNMSASRVSWGVVAKYLNGGYFSKRSYTGAKMYEMEWGLKSRDELRPVQDYADGMYGDGDVYFLNPFAMDKNILPAQWASGYLNAIDGPLVKPFPDDFTIPTYDPLDTITRPPLVRTSTSVNGFPIMEGGIRGVHSLFIPVPNGYTFHLSVHCITPGSFAGGLQASILQAGAVVSGPTPVLADSLTDPVLTGYSAGVVGNNFGILLEATGPDMNYTGMMAQVLPSTQTPNTAQTFKSGQGHSGLQFAEPGIEYYEYSSALDKVQAAANLVEVGSWR